MSYPSNKVAAEGLVTLNGPVTPAKVANRLILLSRLNIALQRNRLVKLLNTLGSKAVGLAWRVRGQLRSAVVIMDAIGGGKYLGELEKEQS